MKLLFFALLTFASFSSFAKTCYIGESEGNPNEYNKHIATLDNIEQVTKNSMVLIKIDGQIIYDFDVQAYYDSAQSQEDINELTEKIVGARVAVISTNVQENQLILAVGTISNNPESLLKSDTISQGDLDSSVLALYDTQNKLAIYCSDK